MFHRITQRIPVPFFHIRHSNVRLKMQAVRKVSPSLCDVALPAMYEVKHSVQPKFPTGAGEGVLKCPCIACQLAAVTGQSH